MWHAPPLRVLAAPSTYGPGYSSFPPPAARKIGNPIAFRSGQFSGQTIRAELHELQQAENGRKYATKDRRPIDPSPVVELRIFVVLNEGTIQQSETEIADYDDVQCGGLFCALDLFATPGTPPPDFSQAKMPIPVWSGVSNVTVPPSNPIVNGGPASTAYSSQAPWRKIGAWDEPWDLGTCEKPWDTNTGADNAAFDRSFEAMLTELTGTASDDAAPSPVSDAYWPSAAATPSSCKRTKDLAGATFTQAVKVSYEGRVRVLFVFTDVAVKSEGTFALRYRCFDLFSNFGGGETIVGDHPVWARCYGGQFRIWATREFPGLTAPTELTEILVAAGVRINRRVLGRQKDVRRRILRAQHLVGDADEIHNDDVDDT